MSRIDNIGQNGNDGLHYDSEGLHYDVMQALKDMPKVEPIRFHPRMAKHASALDTQVGGNHYKDLAIQPVKYIHANNIPFIEGSIIKYVTRWRAKNGIKDLEKARHFIDLLIELENDTSKTTE